MESASNIEVSLLLLNIRRIENTLAALETANIPAYKKEKARKKLEEELRELKEIEAKNRIP